MEKIRFGVLLKMLNESKKRIKQPAFFEKFINLILEYLGSDNRVLLTETDCSRIVKGDKRYTGASKSGGQGIPQELFDCINSHKNDFTVKKIASALKDIKGKSFLYERSNGQEECHILDFDIEKIAKNIKETLKINNDIFNEEINDRNFKKLIDSSKDNYLFFSRIFIYTIIYVSNWTETSEKPYYDDETWRVLDTRIVNGLCSPNTIRSEAYLLANEDIKLKTQNGSFRFTFCSLIFLESNDNFHLFRIFSTVSPTFISFGKSFSDSDIINNLFLIESYLNSKQLVAFIDKFSAQNHWCNIKCQWINLKEDPNSSSERLSATNYLKKTVTEFIKQENDDSIEDKRLPDIVMLEIGSDDFLYRLDIKYIEDSIYKIFDNKKSCIRIIPSNLFTTGVLISSLFFHCKY